MALVRYGGEVKRSDKMLLPMSRPCTRVGKKKLKPYEAVMKMFMKI